MHIASLVIEFDVNKREGFKKALSSIANLSIYGEIDEKIVIVLECENVNEINQKIKKISEFDEVKNVLPVYISEL